MARHRLTIVASLGCLLVALILAACGRGSTTSSTPAGAAGTAGAATAAQSTSAHIEPPPVPAAVSAVLVRFTACMRAHGVLGFPRPTGAHFSLAGTHLNPAGPRYKAAEAYCNQILLVLDSRKLK